MSGYDLSYVAIASRDVVRTTRLFGDGLGMTATTIDAPGGSVSVFRAGRGGIAVFDCEHPLLDRPGEPGLDHIALATVEPAGAAEIHGLPAIGRGDEIGLGGGPQTRVDAAATAGVRLRFTGALDLAASNGGAVERIDHLGIASLDVAGDERVFAGNLGCPVESRQTDMEVRTAVESFTSDKYGVVYHSRDPEPVGGLRVLFIGLGDLELEFLQEFDPNVDRVIEHGKPGSTKQDQGAIGRFVARRGAGLHHIALKTPDIDAALAALDAAGHRVIDRTGRPGSRRARIGFVHPSALGGVLLHFVERQEL